MKTKNTYPRLTLVGAGPGDPDLITVKAINALGEADVVLYDALVNTEILKYVPAGVKKIYVGKRNRKHTYTQEQINALLVDFAFTFGHVVRLKGGDPFVFGRGSEEIDYVRSFNIETAYVPGISSAIGVAGLQGIPLTHRGTSESFTVITGTTSSGRIADEVYRAAQGNGTVVILMGLNKLEAITRIFQAAGKSDLPAAVIQNGSLPTENIALGTVGTIVQATREEQIASPAIIVLGEVVRKHVLYPTLALAGETKKTKNISLNQLRLNAFFLN